MPQSFTKLYTHLVFSTKNRQPYLDEAIRPRVHAYLATVMRSGDCPYVVVGGVADHVHVLFDMGKTHAPVKLVERLKRESSKFVKTLGSKYGAFYWQRGYAMFSVSPTHVADVEKYVRNQEEHHRTQTFQRSWGGAPGYGGSRPSAKKCHDARPPQTTRPGNTFSYLSTLRVLEAA